MTATPDWVRDLLPVMRERARQLAPDASTADDLVQETVLHLLAREATLRDLADRARLGYALRAVENLWRDLQRRPPPEPAGTLASTPAADPPELSETSRGPSAPACLADLLQWAATRRAELRLAGRQEAMLDLWLASPAISDDEVARRLGFDSWGYTRASTRLQVRLCNEWRRLDPR